jgi:hypothetical protein
VLLSIGIGFLGSLSICWLLFGRIHLLTLVFGASLIGVAQDYGIYFLCNRLGADPALDSTRLLQAPDAGPVPDLAGRGDRLPRAGPYAFPRPAPHGGVLCGRAGVRLADGGVLVPALVGGGALSSGPWRMRYGALLAHWPRLRANAAWLALLAALLAVAAFGWSRLGVNDDIRSLQTPPKQLVNDQIRLGKLLDAPTPVQYYLVRGASGEQVLQREEALKQRLDPLVGQGRHHGYQALSNWVPSLRTQATRRALVEAKLLCRRRPPRQAAGRDRRRRGLGRRHPRAPAGASRALDAGRIPGHAGERTVAPPVAWRHRRHPRQHRGAARPQMAPACRPCGWPPTASKACSGSTRWTRFRRCWGAIGSTWAGWCWAPMAWCLPCCCRATAAAWRVIAPAAAASLATLAVLGLAAQACSCSTCWR